ETIKLSRNHCQDCMAFIYCGGECPITFHQRGKLDHGLCEIRRALLETAMKLFSFLVITNKINHVIIFIKQKLDRINVMN
ncbi:MAG: hypothetical protein LBR37_01725, partial [Erysipelotrichaceae bacterium]|nr:hypothetical protein [Erysipelotrichaceae bacterium]